MVGDGMMEHQMGEGIEEEKRVVRHKIGHRMFSDETYNGHSFQW